MSVITTAATVKSPLSYGDAVTLAYEAKYDRRAVNLLAVPFDPQLERMASVLMAVDIASRDQATPDREALYRENERLREALRKIARGEGPYSRDNYQHAVNVIEAMKAAATEALVAPMEVR